MCLILQIKSSSRNRKPFIRYHLPCRLVPQRAGQGAQRDGQSDLCCKFGSRMRVSRGQRHMESPSVSVKSRTAHRLLTVLKVRSSRSGRGRSWLPSSRRSSQVSRRCLQHNIDQVKECRSGDTESCQGRHTVTSRVQWRGFVLGVGCQLGGKNNNMDTFNLLGLRRLYAVLAHSIADYNLGAVLDAS
ncbi:hypothetical protein EJ03DRAFT_82949 [Teratosphaeria nubilosa]|uniref:Uncharacterized protein n=1 Tax=Teratosphaeria nubilosa TaxID=161662 RepID=A0A6G1LAV8_9PEZI|nr:hypothetical protein EJ03DRAFT_82949 [Teratosphaeria nubilosa]